MKPLLFLLASFSLNALHADRPFFQVGPNYPHHLSIGAVLFDREGRIACHHFEEIFGQKEIYILMRESMEDGETPLETLQRGLQEEFGAAGTPVAFLGCLTGPIAPSRFPFDKTTLYIACEVTDWNPEKRNQDDPESSSRIEWLEPDILIPLMQKQGVRFHHRIDADESEIIERALPYLRSGVDR